MGDAAPGSAAASAASAGGSHARQMRETVRRFCEERVEPLMGPDDEAGTFRKELVSGLGSLGAAGVTAPEEHGGLGLGLSDLCLVLGEVARSSVAYAVTLSVSSMVQSIIAAFGAEGRGRRHLPDLAAGRTIGAFSLSESGAGSDIKAMRTTARRERGGYVLDGTKAWVTSGGVAGVYVVTARVDGDPKGISSFIVEDGAPGLSFGKRERKVGWRTSPTTELVLAGCRVPADALLGREGDGLAVALGALDRGRVTIGAIAVGAARRLLDESVRYSLGREQFGRPVFDNQGVQFMLADMAVEIESADLLVREAARSFDGSFGSAGDSSGGSFGSAGDSSGGSFGSAGGSALAAMAKLKATDVCMRAAVDAVQVHGGAGCTTEHPVERFMRDAKILQIVEGTNQIQRMVVARGLRKETKGA